jgi:hypothetical protein
LAQGKRGTSAALGYRPEKHSFPFSRVAAKTGKRGGGALTQGGGLGGLALGYHLAAPVGAQDTAVWRRAARSVNLTMVFVFVGSSALT